MKSLLEMAKAMQSEPKDGESLFGSINAVNALLRSIDTELKRLNDNLERTNNLGN